MSNVVSEGAKNSLRTDLSFFSRSSFADDCVGAIAHCGVRGEMNDVGLKVWGESRAYHLWPAALKTCDESQNAQRQFAFWNREKGIAETTLAVGRNNSEIKKYRASIITTSPLYPGCPCRHAPVRLPMIYTHKTIVQICPHNRRCKVTTEKKMRAPVWLR
jgi:hypothetical protein